MTTKWTFNNKILDDISDKEGMIGFVYKITNRVTGKIYIGKKILFNSRKTRISNREKTLTRTRKTFKVQTKESDWKSYYGSSLELKKDVDSLGKEKFSREILEFTTTKKKLSYLEVKYMFKYDVLESDTYNGNILNRFFRKDLE